MEGGPTKAFRINEIKGLWEYLGSIDWSEPWFSALGIFHVMCVLLTIVTRKTGPVQTVYFAVLMLLVFFAESINTWAAENWKLFARQQYFDSNGMFISIIFSVPILCNCIVMVVSWLWDVGVLISDVKRLKYRIKKKDSSSQEKDGVDGKNDGKNAVKEKADNEINTKKEQ